MQKQNHIGLIYEEISFRHYYSGTTRTTEKTTVPVGLSASLMFNYQLLSKDWKNVLTENRVLTSKQ